MPTEIEGTEFTGFARLDMENLVKLDYSGRVKWLRYRFALVFLTPFRKFVQLDGADCYVWLCVVSRALHGGRSTMRIITMVDTRQRRLGSFGNCGGERGCLRSGIRFLNR
jgi:hypothetical protein